MGSDPVVATEVLSALGVFLGALAGGVAAIVAELRRPVAPVAQDAAEGPPAQEAARVIAAVREESDHLNRTIWTVEKKLGEHLHRIEREILARGSGPGGPREDGA